jgi:hypothetical protein
MAFVSDLPHDDTMSFLVVARESAHETEVRVPIGHDPDSELRYSLIVAFYTLPEEDYGEGAMEVSFEIVAIGAGQPIYFLNGIETKAFLVTAEIRAQVLEIVAFTVREVLQRRKPLSVHMATKNPGTPRKALVKYQTIASAIRQAGFKGGKVDPYEGIDNWMFVAI